MLLNDARPLVREFIEARLKAEGEARSFELYVVWFGTTTDKKWTVRIRSTLPERYIYDVSYDHGKTKLKVYRQFELMRKILIEEIDY